MLSNGIHPVPLGKIAMVVTHLEMRERAGTKDIPLPEGVTFRKVSPDLDWYRDIIRRVGQEWLWFSRLRMDDKELGAVLEHPDVDIYTLQLGPREEAILELDFREDGECELAFFGLTQQLIGTGAGRALMDRAISLAWARPISRFHVHTCTFDSPQALSFYVRSGFDPYKTEVEIADDPRLSGLLPATSAPHIPTIKGLG